MKSPLFRILSTAAFAAFAGSASAVFDPVNDDTDIFLQNPAYIAARPNVLIFVDNTANWGQSADGTTKFQGVRTALTSVLNSVVNDTFNVGLAMFVETGGSNVGLLNEGSYVRYGIRQMSGTAADVTSNKGRLVAILNALDETADKSNAARYSTALTEVLNYFAGLPSYTGHGKTKADAGDTVWTPSGRVALPGSPLPAGGHTSNTPVNYTSPIIDSCQKSFIIWISNGEAMDDSLAIQRGNEQYQIQTGTSPGTIALNPSDLQAVVSDEYARYMANADCNTSVTGVQNVYTYTIDVLPRTTGTGDDHTALLRSMALYGKGKYFPITSLASTAQIEDALRAIFQEVQAVNSVFASATLPVSVNVRGTNVNQIYLGVFRPDAQKSPRWFGNLKLYKLGVDTATNPPTLFLADANGQPAHNSSTGFISPNAVSFWTTASSYWGFREPELNGVGGASDSPDGDTVEKGGAAQRERLLYLTSNAPRKLYTCIDGSGGLCAAGASLSATPFNTSTISPADVGAYTTKPVVSLSASGTLAAAKVTAHGWATGNVVRIQGANPSVFNGDVTITVVDANTFTYTLPSAPDVNRARVDAPNHLLTAGDVVCVDAFPAGYYSCTYPFYAPITREDANFFTYPMSAPETTNAQWWTVWGGRQITSVTRAFGTDEAIISLPSHGFGTSGTIGCAYLFDDQFGTWYEANCRDATIVDAHGIRIPTDYPISGTPNTALVTANSHGFLTGQTITITNSAVASFNGAKTITKLNDNQFTFPSTEVNSDRPLLGTSTIRVGHGITNITHPTTGSGRDTATVTTATAHGFTPLQSINIYGTGAFFATGYDGVWIVQSTPTATTFTISNSSVRNAPANLSPATGIAGYTASKIESAMSIAGAIHFYRTLTVNSITPAATAQGSMTAGRPSDGDTGVRDLLVNWVRSTDNRDNEDRDNDPTDVRASVHGDVLHSRPAAVNYGRFPTDPTQPANDNDVYVFYGSNDGIFRAVKGGIATDESGVAPGDERWGFIPREFFGKLSRLREQSPRVSSLNQKDYLFDGSIGVYQKDVTPAGGRAGTVGDDPGDKVHLYISLRRGGDFIYALDVKDPAAPKLLWRKGRGDPGWGEKGQAWSEPKVTRLNWAFDPTNNPDNVVIVFGAGYDDALEDINPCLLQEFNASNVVRKAIGSGIVTYLNAGSCSISGATGTPTTISRTRGRGILVVNAFTGAVLWQVGPAPTGATHNLTHSDMTCAIPSDVSVLDRNRDGYGDRLYVGDTCGNVWRAEISNQDPRNWKVTKIAALSYGANTQISTKLKFLFAPDIVFAKDSIGPHTAVLIGSGDREHPFDSIVQNSFFMIKDRDAMGSSDGVMNSTTKSISVSTSGSSAAPISSSDVFDATDVDGVNQFGWKIDLRSGEKTVAMAVTVGGTTFFNTNQPDSGAGGGTCGSNLGVARQYLVSYVDASATRDLNGLGGLSIANRSAVQAGGGFMPGGIPIVAEIDGQRYQGVCSGPKCDQAGSLPLDTRLRTYWYRELDN
jgi:type IV pilus assembly protein PilY1